MKKSRRKKHEEHENHERWLVSYADFITLLFAFFVVMYATSNSDETKQKEFEDSVRAELKLAVISKGAGGSSGGSQLVPEIASPIDAFPRRNAMGEVQDYVERRLRRHFTKEELETVVRFERDPHGARILLPAASLFPTGEGRLRKSSLETLDKIAGILKDSERRVVIEGHTDNQETGGWELASQRATSLVRYLIKYQGMDPARIAATSYADQRPVVPNDTEENRARNRRIEILVTPETADE